MDADFYAERLGDLIKVTPLTNFARAYIGAREIWYDRKSWPTRAARIRDDGLTIHLKWEL